MKLKRLHEDNQILPQATNEPQVSPWPEQSPLVKHVARQAFRRLATYAKRLSPGATPEHIVSHSWPNNIGTIVFGNEFPNLITYGVLENNSDGTFTFNLKVLKSSESKQST